MIQEIEQTNRQSGYREVLLDDDSSLVFEKDGSDVKVLHVDYLLNTSAIVCIYRNGSWINKISTADKTKQTLFWNFVKSYPKKTNKIIKELTTYDTALTPFNNEWTRFQRKVNVQSFRINKAFKNLKEISI